MLAAILKDYNQLVVEDIPIPEPASDEVLVRIKSCGICATDYKAIKGIRRNISFPFIPGHEPAGVVAAVGSEVKNVREGDEVIVQPSGFCGMCHNCRAGRTHYCEHAYVTGGDGPEDVRPGSFAEYMITGSNTLYHKPSCISFDSACQTEPVSGAWKGLIQYSQMSVGEDVVIIGTGGIGAYCLMIAKAAGAGRLIAVDNRDHALETAKRLGATHTINPAKCKLKSAIYEILPKGPDLIIESAGSIEAVKDMFSLFRHGTRCNLFGITTHEKFELDGGLMHFLEARMDASFGTTPHAMESAIRLIEGKLVDPEQIVSHRFHLTQIHEAIRVMKSGEGNKIIINT